MYVGNKVRSYLDEDYFNEGKIVSIDDDGIRVDFFDWVKLYHPDDLVFECNYFAYWRALRPGVMIADYR